MRRLLGFALCLGALLPLATAQDLPLTGLGHAGVRVSDIDKAKSFYTGVLGYQMPFNLMMPNDPDQLMLDYYKVNDTQFLEIYPGLKPDMTYRMTHVAFNTDDIDKLHKMLEDRGFNPSPIHLERTGNKSFGIRPPSGQELAFIEFTQYLPGSLHSNTIGKDMPNTRLSDHMQFVGILVTDMDAAHLFYKTMGFAEIWRGPAEGGSGGEQIDMQLPGKSHDYIELIHEPADISAEEARMAQHFGFATSDILVTYKSAIDAGGKTTGKPHPGADGKLEFGILDPDGTLVLFRDSPSLKPKVVHELSDVNISVDNGDLAEIHNDHGVSRDGSTLGVSAGNIYPLPATGSEPTAITSKIPSYFHGFSPDAMSFDYVSYGVVVSQDIAKHPLNSSEQR